MISPKKAILLVFVALSIFDLIHCIIPGQAISQWLRPILMFVLLLWILPRSTFSNRHLMLIFALITASLATYFFYSHWSSQQNIYILLIILKSTFFINILYQDIKNTLSPSGRLFRWALNYFLLAIGVSFMISGFENWLIYIIAIQASTILLFISLQKSNSGLFRQLYFGYTLIIFSMIFGTILLSDPRWFIEVITRFAFISGHFLFVAGLAKIKISYDKEHILAYRSVE